ncbi:hypothetical protein EDB86DRAFT_2813517, partial [Lactarius hatsudake]
LDGPLTWGIPPARMYLQSHMMWWTLGIFVWTPAFFPCHALTALTAHFQAGRDIRGTSIYQPAIDTAIERCAQARGCIHLFAERKVCQPHTYATDPQTGLAHLRRFKWGIPRVLPHVDNRCAPPPPSLPVSKPIPHAGFDGLMPDSRHAPWRYLPRPGARLSVMFGTPASPPAVHGVLGTTMRSDVVPRKEEARRREDREMRIALTEDVQRAVEALGRQVLGDLLAART